MTGKITVLGSGTCQIQLERMASSLLVEWDDLRFVFDFGRGISQRLCQIGLKQDDLGHIVVSHFHPDHCSDLIPYLHAACWSQIDPRQEDLHLYGPDGLVELISLFGLSALRSSRFNLLVHNLKEASFLMAKIPFFSQELPPSGNRGLKFQAGEKIIAFTGDSHYHQQEIEFLKRWTLRLLTVDTSLTSR